MLANYTIRSSDFYDRPLLKENKVAWWEKYDEYLTKWKDVKLTC
jgi:hypothetical protein